MKSSCFRPSNGAEPNHDNDTMMITILTVYDNIMATMTTMNMTLAVLLDED